ADDILLLQFSQLLGFPCLMRPHRDCLDLHSALLNEEDLMLPIHLYRSFNSSASSSHPLRADCKYSSIVPFRTLWSGSNRMVWISPKHSWERAWVTLKEPD